MFYKNNILNILPLLFITILFFSFPVIITFDTGHYFSYVDILENKVPLSSWDPVRGPIFPIILYSIKHILGTYPQTYLVILFLLYLLFINITHKLIGGLGNILSNKVMFFITITINPIFFGYFHTLLTEAFALPLISITFLIIHNLYKLHYNNSDIQNKQKEISLIVYLSITTIILWHLKQPYGLIPIISTSLLAFVFLINHKYALFKKILITLLINIFFLVISIYSWNYFLLSNNVDLSTRSTQALIKTSISSSVSKSNINIITIIKNYLTIANVLETKWVNNLPYSSNKFSLKYSNENNTIGMRYLNASTNNVIADLSSIPKGDFITSNLLQEQSKSKILNNINRIFPFYNILFKFIIILLPFSSIYHLINKQWLLFISSATSLTFIIFFSAMYYPIDRYSIPILPISILQFIALINYKKLMA